MRSPNKEQLKAIEHNGSVVLSAGAGSGKTFVLVEHIIFLLKSFHEKNFCLDQIQYEIRLKKYLTSIVVMTFTKKAAGEIEIRLRQRIMEFLENSMISEMFREIIIDLMPSLTVSTIHGFCHRLLTYANFNNEFSEIRISDQEVFETKIDRLLSQWVNKQIEVNHGPLNQTIVRNYDSLNKAFCKIFSKPEIRSMWVKPSSFTKESFNIFLKNSSEVLEIDDLARDGFNLEGYSDYSDKKWFFFISEFNELIKNDVSSVELINLYINFFEKHKGVRAPSKKQNIANISDVMSDIKKIREIIFKNSDALLAYYNDSEHEAWGNVFKDIFCHIEKQYLVDGGLTFSDLEFQTFQNLHHEAFIKKISEICGYFVVDEFQDTSSIQYEIIKKILKNDLSRFFAIGDIKQAIYGFRGGELGVFIDSMNDVERNLSLNNNYRSTFEIINFCNYFFEQLFETISFEKQLAPEIDDKKEVGIVEQQNIIITDENIKLNAEGLNFTESREILKLIEKIFLQGEKEICVLYKKLSPAKYLINELLKRSLSFSAQMKIVSSEDPIIGIFKVLIEMGVGFKEKKNMISGQDYVVFLIKSYLEILGVNHIENIQESVSQFSKDIKYLGIFNSFNKLLFSMNISNSNHENNIKKIRLICELGNDEFGEIFKILGNSLSNVYSLDFLSGNSKQKVKIMTVHSSKGLEFDNVIIGGIHTNGRGRADTDLIGEIPGSFKWKRDPSQKKAFKTPQYIFEELVKKRKEKQESKRLLYVACTRAKKTLRWINLKSTKNALSVGDESWINHFRKFKNNDSLKINERNIDLSNEMSKQISRAANRRPLFHYDNVGIITKKAKLTNTERLGLVSELSVTKLLSIAECPRKFYFSNILNIGDEELKIIQELTPRRSEKTKTRTGISSASRGTKVHKLISDYLVSKDERILSECINELGDDKVNWLLNIFRPLSIAYEMVSEREFKFKLFSYVISGIPDLMLFPNNNEAVFSLVDFKTGLRAPEKEDIYIFQLYLYAYASYALEYLKRCSDLKLSIIYLDEMVVIERVVKFSEIEKYISDKWSLLNDLSKQQITHCLVCSFENLCF